MKPPLALFFLFYLRKAATPAMWFWQPSFYLTPSFSLEPDFTQTYKVLFINKFTKIYLLPSHFCNISQNNSFLPLISSSYYIYHFYYNLLLLHLLLPLRFLLGLRRKIQSICFCLSSFFSSFSLLSRFIFFFYVPLYLILPNPFVIYHHSYKFCLYTPPFFFFFSDPSINFLLYFSFFSWQVVFYENVTSFQLGFISQFISLTFFFICSFSIFTTNTPSLLLHFITLTSIFNFSFLNSFIFFSRCLAFSVHIPYNDIVLFFYFCLSQLSIFILLSASFALKLSLRPPTLNLGLPMLLISM